MKKTKWLILIISLITSLLMAPYTYAGSNSASILEKISQTVKDNRQGFSGTLVVYRGGTNPIERYYALGLADVKSQTPFTENTVVDIASITKQFTGAAIVRLASQKKLTIQDSLGQHIAGLKPQLSVISIHELLTTHFWFNGCYRG